MQTNDNTETPSRRLRVRLAAGLAVAVLIAFSPALSGEFLSWDDDTNFLDNTAFRGLGWGQVRWAFTTFLLGVYQPFAWLLLEMQYVVGGLKPWVFHFTSLILHVLNTILVYRVVVALLARRESGQARAETKAEHLAAAGAALLWGLHPLRTEAVAWVSCQPYLLCATFVWLAVLSYLPIADAGRWRFSWLASLGFYAAALLSKAEAVALPLALLVLDVYPLRRLGGERGWWRRPAARRAWLEKLPFFALAAAFSAVAVRARLQGQDLVEPTSLGSHVAHAATSVWFYLGKTLLPTDLSPYYRRPPELDAGFAVPAHAIAAVAAVVVTVLVLRYARRAPALAAAWMVYLAFLLPHGGLVRIGTQLGSDRYTYVSSVAFAAALAGALVLLAQRSPRRAPRSLVAGLLSLSLVLVSLTRDYARIWESSGDLFSYAYAKSGASSSHVANNWGGILLQRGQYDEAAQVFGQAVSLSPKNVKASLNLATALMAKGDRAGATAALDRAVATRPNDPQVWIRRGQIYFALGQRPAAEESLARAQALAPDRPDVAELSRQLAGARQR